MQDFRNRPLTLKTIFRIKSPIAALDFLYGDRPDLTVDEISRILDMNHEPSTMLIQDDGDEPDINVILSYVGGDLEELVADSDLTEAELVDDFAQRLQNVFGYEIKFSNKDQEEDLSFQQLQTLGGATHLIVQYFDNVLAEDENQSGLSVFQQYFSQTASGEQVIVELGANEEAKAGSAFTGKVYLEPGASEEDRKSIYLGSHVTIATTTHEFFHQLNRFFGRQMSSNLRRDDFESMWERFQS